jgi:hypothetical protein
MAGVREIAVWRRPSGLNIRFRIRLSTERPVTLRITSASTA